MSPGDISNAALTLASRDVFLLGHNALDDRRDHFVYGAKMVCRQTRR
jgi:hypothetical protein